MSDHVPLSQQLLGTYIMWTLSNGGFTGELRFPSTRRSVRPHVVMCETVYLASSRSYFEPSTPLHLLSTKAEATTVDDPSRRPFFARFLMYTEEKMFQVHGSLLLSYSSS